MESVVFSVIFSANLKFFDCFINSLNNQSYKDFDLYLINDGVSLDILNSKLKNAKFSFYLNTLKDKLSPTEIRELGFKEMYKSHYTNVIFADTDDYMSSNRIERSVGLLENYPIVFTDITLVDENNNVIKSLIWKERLIDEIIDEKFLYDKNVLGLGNSAILKAYLKKIKIPREIIAVDWYFFSLIIKNEHAGFIADAVTYYRQHSNNTIGLKGLSLSRLKFIFEVKRYHYLNMSTYNPKYLSLLDDIEIKEKLLSLENVSNYEIKNFNLNFFWWEETNYINSLLSH